MLYCSTAMIGIGWLPRVRRDALIWVEKASDGLEQLQATIYTNTVVTECGTNLGPFPELEQLRAKRRLALGKAD